MSRGVGGLTKRGRVALAAGIALTLLAGCSRDRSRNVPAQAAVVAPPATPVPITSGTGSVSSSVPSVPVLETIDARLGLNYTFPLGADPDSIRLRSNDLGEAQQAGFKVLRFDLLWNKIEPRRGQLDFAPFDRIVNDARSRGFEVLGILCYGVPWATRWGFLGDNTFAPDNPGDYARFVGETVRHFKGRIKRFEIWNEQNTTGRFWKPLADPRAYGELLVQGYAAAKAANPEATIVFGGLFYQEVPAILIESGPAFTDRVYQAHPKVGSSYDVYAFHPYRYPFVAPEGPGRPFPPFMTGQETFLETIDASRAVLAKHGDGKKPIWITEAGWHTAAFSPPPLNGVSEQEQARYLVRAAVMAFAKDAELFVWHTLRDGKLHSIYQEDAFGVLAHDPQPLDATPARRKPAFFAHRTLAARLAGTRFERDVRGDLGLPAPARAYRFASSSSGRRVTVVWTSGALPPGTRAKIPMGQGTVAEAIALNGSVTALAPAAGAVWVTPGEDPVFVDVR